VGPGVIILNITVFGGAKPQSGETSYEDAMQLGRVLAQTGHTVLTGGYMGTMEAVSRGAAEAGGHVIGITCEEIERWRDSRANPWVKEEWKMPTLVDRLIKLIDSCDAAIALPGGPGTLAEISLMWNRIIIAAIIPKPLILIGPGWQKVFMTLYDTLGQYISEDDRKLISFVQDNDRAVSFLKIVRPD
jgi:uncharacterized protein (TIGR00730 family)